MHNPGKRKDPDGKGSKGNEQSVEPFKPQAQQPRSEAEKTRTQSRTKSSFRVPPMTMNPRKWALGALLPSAPSWNPFKEEKPKEEEKIDPPLDSTTGEYTASEAAVSVREETTHSTDTQSPIRVGGGELEDSSDMSDSQATIRRNTLPTISSSELDQTSDVDKKGESPAQGDCSGRCSPKSVPVEPHNPGAAPAGSELSFQYLRVFLPTRSINEEEILEERVIGYATEANLIAVVALPPGDDQYISHDVANELRSLLENTREALDEGPDVENKSVMSAKAFVTDGRIHASEPPSSRYSEPAFDTWDVLHHPDVCEVISRPMSNSRPWTTGKREMPSDEGREGTGKVYMELMGSEATLVDIDRSLSSVHSEWFG